MSTSGNGLWAGSSIGNRVWLGARPLCHSITFGVQLRQFIKQRGGQGLNVQEVNLRIPDNQTVLLMQRGAEGFFAVNMSASAFEIPSIDLTLTDLEGCYNELRNNCTVAIQRASNSKKYGTRWGDLQSGRHAATGKGCSFFRPGSL